MIDVVEQVSVPDEGVMVTVGEAFTVSVALLLEMDPLITQRYWFPFSLIVRPVRVRVALVAPVILLQVEPLFADTSH